MRTTLIPWLAVSLLVAPAAVFAADKPEVKPTAAVAEAVKKPVPAYRLIKEKSSLKFYAIQNGAPVEGKFTDFDADIHFDADQADKSGVKLTVKTGSVAVANEDVENNIKLPEWLGVDAFPEAVFISTALTRMPRSDNYYADGKLTLHGKTLPVVLNFQIENSDEKTAIAKGYVTLHRIEFGVGQGQWAKDDVIKDEVRVEFRIVAEKK